MEVDRESESITVQTRTERTITHNNLAQYHYISMNDLIIIFAFLLSSVLAYRGNVSGTRSDVLNVADGSRQQKWEVGLRNSRRFPAQS